MFKNNAYMGTFILRCPMCGNICRYIAVSHLRREHNMTVMEFLQKYPTYKRYILFNDGLIKSIRE